MHLTLLPVEIPFSVGATVWVNQVCGDNNEYLYYQATIVQIILDGSLTNSIVIRHLGDVHELRISNGIYDLKPMGAYSQLGRRTVTVSFMGGQTVLFETELTTYVDRGIYAVHGLA